MPRSLKILIALVLLGTLAWGVDWEQLPVHLSRSNWGLAALAIVVVALEMPINAWKWQWSLRLHDLLFTWTYLFRTGCFAYFLNNFLPSAIGGDVYRVLRTSSGGERSSAVSAVLCERAVGLVAMLCNGFIGALVLVHQHELARWYVQISIGVVAISSVLASLRYVGAFSSAGRWLSRLHILKPVLDNLRRISRARREWLPLIATSFLFQLMAALAVYLAFLGVGADIGLSTALLITAAAGLASILPIAISGIGVVEGSIAGAAVALGVDYDAALLAAIILRLITLPVSAASGLLYLTEPNEATLSITRTRTQQ